MLKIATFYCAISEKCCSVVGGRGIPLFFRPHPGGYDSSRVPTPGNLLPKAKKKKKKNANANARGSARGGAGCSWN